MRSHYAPRMKGLLPHHASIGSDLDRQVAEGCDGGERPFYFADAADFLNRHLRRPTGLALNREVRSLGSRQSVAPRLTSSCTIAYK